MGKLTVRETLRAHLLLPIIAFRYGSVKKNGRATDSTTAPAPAEESNNHCGPAWR